VLADLAVEALGAALGQASTEGLDRPAHVVDELGPRPDQRLARADDRQVGLRGLSSMLDRREQTSIEACQAGEVLGIEPVVLAALGVDEPELAGVGHQDLVGASSQHAADPGRVRARLERHAHRLDADETPLEGLRGRGDAGLFDDLAGLGVQQAQVAVAVSYVDAEGDAVLGHGQALLSWALFRPTNANARHRRSSVDLGLGLLIPSRYQPSANIRLTG
jgi:hypothetical protein